MPGTRRALSLIELTIVILIIGITAAIAAPRLSDTVRATKLRAAANQVAAHVDYIRSSAINQSRTVTLSCDNSSAVYRCADVDYPERPGLAISVSIRHEYDPAFDLDANFDNKTAVSFDLEGVPYVDGAPLTSGRITISYGGESMSVWIAAGTGETTVARGKLQQVTAEDAKFSL